MNGGRETVARGIMNFLHINEAAEWCQDHGMKIGERWELLPDGRLVHSSRLVYSPDGPTKRASEIAHACLAALGPWDECLLWAIDWDIWESGEDWPGFYAARGARGERHSVAAKPGHLFLSGETEELLLFLRMVLEYSWDAHVLPIRGSGSDRRLWCSHDGWVDLRAATPVDISQAVV